MRFARPPRAGRRIGREGALLAALTAARRHRCSRSPRPVPTGRAWRPRLPVTARAGLRADAAAAAELAVAATRSAATLVDVNLALLGGDHRRERAHSSVAAADRSGCGRPRRRRPRLTPGPRMRVDGRRHASRGQASRDRSAETSCPSDGSESRVSQGAMGVAREPGRGRLDRLRRARSSPARPASRGASRRPRSTPAADRR